MNSNRLGVHIKLVGLYVPNMLRIWFLWVN